MARSAATPSKVRSPSERDQFWLDHNAAQASSGQTAKEYASAQGLSFHAFYQARKRLRVLGLLAPAARRQTAVRTATKAKAVAFSKIAVAKAEAALRFRLELPGGLALEWDGGDVPAPVVSLLDRFARQP